MPLYISLRDVKIIMYSFFGKVNGTMKKLRILNANALKLIALATMTIDHAGLYLFGNMTIMRIIGRIAFPIYAYMIAEGCRYTKNKLKYFLNVFLIGVIFQFLRYPIFRDFQMCVLVTFGFSILVIYSIQYAKSKKSIISMLVPAAVIAATIAICYGIPKFFPGLGFGVEYGILGVAVPVIVSLSDDRDVKLILAAFALVLLSADSYYLQWYSLLALIPLFLYNGERGKLNMKYFFYAYYPLHLVVIRLIKFFI